MFTCPGQKLSVGSRVLTQPIILFIFEVNEQRTLILDNSIFVAMFNIVRSRVLPKIKGGLKLNKAQKVLHKF